MAITADRMNCVPIQLKRPEWIKKKITGPMMGEEISALIIETGLHTVCQEALCPNIMECFTAKTATFLLLGPNCSRRCTFCAINKDEPAPPDPEETEQIVKAVDRLNLSYVVLTMVTRDDLRDGGANHIAATLRAIHRRFPDMGVELLISDLAGNDEALLQILDLRPDVLNHNLETVPRLYPLIRPGADYQRSLHLIERAGNHNPRSVTKSGLMLGLGETRKEVLETMSDLRKGGCDLITIGQYLAPSRGHYPVASYASPDEFKALKASARAMGFKGVESGPFVRSSYKAEELFRTAGNKTNKTSN